MHAVGYLAAKTRRAGYLLGLDYLLATEYLVAKTELRIGDLGWFHLGSGANVLSQPLSPAGRPGPTRDLAGHVGLPQDV